MSQNTATSHITEALTVLSIQIENGFKLQAVIVERLKPVLKGNAEFPSEPDAGAAAISRKSESSDLASELAGRCMDLASLNRRFEALILALDL